MSGNANSSESKGPIAENTSEETAERRAGHCYDLMKEGARRQILSYPPWTADQLAESLRKDFPMAPRVRLEETAEILAGLATEDLEEILYMTSDDTLQEEALAPQMNGTVSGVSLTVDWLARGKAQLITESNGRILHADVCNVCSEKRREEYLSKLVTKCPGAEPVIEELRQQIIQASIKGRPAPSGQGSDLRQPDAELLEKHDKATERELEAMSERGEAEDLLRDPGLMNRVVADCCEVGVVGEQELACTLFLVYTSRLLRKPLAAIVQGSSSSGKSWVVDGVARLFPKESLLLASDLTQNALYYFEEGALMHRVVIAGERPREQDDASAERTRALREMISTGRLRKCLPEKGSDGRLVTKVIDQPGPIAYVESTTISELFEEDANRALLLSTDSGEEQTRRILRAAGAAATGTGTVDVQHIVDVHHALQRLLRRVRVTIPYADRFAEAVPADCPEARRAIHHAFGLIRSSAVFHQRQRPGFTDTHGCVIEATGTDYAIAYRLLRAPLGRSLGRQLPEHVVRFRDWLRSTFPDREFRAGEVVAAPTCPVGRTQVYDRISALVGKGGVRVIRQEGRANVYRVDSAADESQAAGACWLPKIADLGLSRELEGCHVTGLPD